MFGVQNSLYIISRFPYLSQQILMPENKRHRLICLPTKMAFKHHLFYKINSSLTGTIGAVSAVSKG
jgi:hypothetical protein